MRNKIDQKILEQLKTINTISQNLIDWAEGTGSFDAACDRGIENVIELAKEMEETHESMFLSDVTAWRADIRGLLLGIGDKVVTRAAVNSHTYLLIGQVVSFTKKNLVQVYIPDEDRYISKEAKCFVKL